jgi:hypothetical protein
MRGRPGTDKTRVPASATASLRSQGYGPSAWPTAQKQHRQRVKRSATREDQRNALTYPPLGVVRFGRGVESLGIGGGEYLTVLGRTRDTNIVLLNQHTAHSDTAR